MIHIENFLEPWVFFPLLGVIAGLWIALKIEDGDSR